MSKNTHTYTIDESSIFEAVDSKLASLDKDTLLKIRKKLKEQNEDTELIDKALMNKSKQEQLAKEENKSGLLSTLFGVFLGLSDNKHNKKEKQTDYLMPWEQEEVKKGNYDPWNFEEEELEDDDYYNDDLD